MRDLLSDRGTLTPMHRTDGIDPEFMPVTYGEVWVRVYDTDEDKMGAEPNWRHFHVSPQVGHEITVDEAVTTVESLNESERYHEHQPGRFEYYAVEVQVTRAVARASADV